MLDRKRAHIVSEDQVLREMNLLITGWTNYYNHGNPSAVYLKLERFIAWKFSKYLAWRHKYRMSSGKFKYTEPFDMGMKRLTGRVSYPNNAS